MNKMNVDAMVDVIVEHITSSDEKFDNLPLVKGDKVAVLVNVHV